MRPCSRDQGRRRLDDAHTQLDLAEVATPDDPPSERKAAISSAVLAGIAAADCACCVALGERSRGDSHREAAAVLERIEPGGKEAASAFIRLISLKDASQYGFDLLSGDDLKRAVRCACQIVEFAAEVYRR